MLKLEVTKEQADVMYNALDCYMRAGLGQIKYAMEHFLNDHIKHKEFTNIRDKIDNCEKVVSKILHGSENANYGIGHKCLNNKKYTSAYEMYHELGEVLRPTVPIHQGHLPLFKHKKIIKK